MYQRLSGLCLLCLVFAGISAQEIRKYDYWTDNDYSTHQTVTGSKANISIQLPVDNMEPGLHYLNFRVQNTDKEWSNLYRYLFYLPDMSRSEATLKGYECWMDDDMTTFVRKETAENNFSFSLDVSMLPSGLHYFNFREFTSIGEYGNLHRSLFFLPDIEAEEDVTEVEYEYWIDDNEENAVTGVSPIGELLLTVDIDGLGDGEHTFYFRARKPKGHYGELFTATFELITTGIDDQTIVDEQTDNHVIYHTDGKRVPTLQRGINIIRMGDGTTKKIMVK